MAYHVPFSQRQNQRPVYIGFEPPAPQPIKRTNWWGISGLMVSIGGLLTCGLFAPFGLLISLIGLGRGPRKAAIAGTILSLVGMSITASIDTGSINHQRLRHQQRSEAKQAIILSQQVKQGEQKLLTALADLKSYRTQNEGALPEAIDGNLLMIRHKDPWGQELRYEVEINQATVRTAGPDGDFDTPDDLTTRIKGDTDSEPLLPFDR